jgi:protein SCO1/2
VVLLVLFMAPDADAGLPVFAYDQRLGNQVPLAVRFRDEQGNAVSLRQMLDHRPTILVLGNFHERSLVRDDLMQALSRMDGPCDCTVVVLSVDPSDTAADARSARQADIAGSDHPEDTANWHYLTGTEPGISAVTEAVGFRYRFDGISKRLLHPAGLVFLTAEGGVSSYLLGPSYNPRDIGVGIARAAGDMSARVLPILLLGFDFDRMTGRGVARWVQIGAGLSMLFVSAVFTLALRRSP